ncbi:MULTISPECIES: acetyltransferase [Flavobacteriaceae]|uniref:acetyltransferase n=1 Tax=Flavobacteriaceae TaxID=49546 RepID=UPI001492986D|nr:MULTISPECIES: acetyltransferase [Allomuricauda]MDC6366880.1 acetyltransferase [Muricauda sp. AC10]
MSKKSLIIGAGTHGQIYASYLAEAGIEVVGFIDDNEALYGKSILNIPIVGTFEDLNRNKIKQLAQNVYCPIGNNRIREKYLSECKKMGYDIPSFFHHTSCIGPDTHMGEANYMLPGSIVMPHTKIGDFFMVNMSSTIGHHVIIGNGVFMSSGVNVGANLELEDYVYVGIGATIMSSIGKIGKDSLIGAGSVIIRSVEPNSTMVGNPGRALPKK